ncbi:MAG: hypothetical protein Q4G28_00095 [Neisseria sp.]|nr:hypothetical protein [Neisseria sp.]
MPEQLQRRFAPVLYIVMFFAGFFAAFLWFNPRDYLDNLAATVTAVAALALVPLAYFFSRLSLQHRRRESARLEALQQENVRPVLHAVLRPAADAPHLIELAVSNHGRGTAHAVRLRVETVAATPAAEAVAAALQPLAAFSDGLDMLAAAESYNGVFADFDTLARRFAPAPFNGTIRIVAEYQDIFGNACASESVLDISALAALQTETAAPARKPRKKLLY